MKQNTILLVEDDFLNRRLIRKTLTDAGYKVLEAKNSKEAIEILNNDIVDIAILDINLGEHEQNGIELSNRIKEKFNIPFIYLTAYDTDEITSKAIHTKPHAYITKPFKSVDIIISVELALLQKKELSNHMAMTMLVRDGEYKTEIEIDDIHYIESEGNYLTIYTDQHTFKCRSTIKQILEQLPANNFVQTHRAYIVNKKKIDKFSSKSVVIKNAVIPVSKNYMGTLKTL